MISIHIHGYSLDFWTKIKSKTIFGYGIPSPFGRSNRFFDRWPFLAVFGHFWPFFGHLLVISRVIYEYSLDFWTKMKNKTIFGNGIPSPFGWLNRFFGRWPFLAIFGDFW